MLGYAFDPHMPWGSASTDLFTAHVFCLSDNVSYVDAAPRVCGVLQDGGNVKVEVVIGAPQRGPYHLALRHANPGTLFTGTLQPLVVSPSPVQLSVSLVTHVQLNIMCKQYMQQMRSSSGIVWLCRTYRLSQLPCSMCRHKSDVFTG